MFHRAVLADKGLLLAFHKSFQALFLELWLADLPVPVSLFVTPLSAGVFARCFTVNHRGKPGPLRRVLFGRFHGLSWCFAVSPGDTRGRFLPPPSHCVFWVFCLGRVTRPTAPACPPPLLQRYFSGLVHGAVPTQIETCQCALCLHWHRLEWRFSPTASIRAPGSSQTDREAESKLLAQAALFAHAWRWYACHHGNGQGARPLLANT